jgi:hypothetical protein
LRSGVAPPERKREEDRIIAECQTEILGVNLTSSAIRRSFLRNGQRLGPGSARTVFIVIGNSEHPADRKAADDQVGLFRELLKPALTRHNVDCFLAPGSVRSGKEWNREVREHLLRARWAVLWVTAAFLNSWFVQKRELPFVVDGQRHQKVELFPILAQECCWEHANFLPELQWAVDRDKPLEAKQRRSQRRILKGVCSQLERAFANS